MTFASEALACLKDWPECKTMKAERKRMRNGSYSHSLAVLDTVGYRELNVE